MDRVTNLKTKVQHAEDLFSHAYQIMKETDKITTPAANRQFKIDLNTMKESKKSVDHQDLPYEYPKFSSKR